MPKRQVGTISMAIVLIGLGIMDKIATMISL
jgi:hypothetical protein